MWTYEERNLAERLLLKVRRGLVFPFRHVHRHELEWNFLLAQDHRDESGRGGEVSSVELQNHLENMIVKRIGSVGKRFESTQDEAPLYLWLINSATRNGIRHHLGRTNPRSSAELFQVLSMVRGKASV